MSAFQFDTSGFVQGWIPPFDGRIGYAGPNRVFWSDLTPFAQGYTQAMHASWTQPGGDPDTWDEQGWAFSDLAPETLAWIIEDCERFCAGAGYYTADDAMRFWRRRQSGGEQRYGFPPITSYIGDDGLVYLREAGQ